MSDHNTICLSNLCRIRDHDRAKMNMAHALIGMALSLIGIGFILGVLAAMLFHALFIAGQVNP